MWLISSNFIELFCMFFIWSCLLFYVAYNIIDKKIDFLVHNTSKNILFFFLILASTISFIAAIPTLSYSPIYMLLISALWITVYTDSSYMVISRWVSLYLIPVGILSSYFNIIPISPLESLITCLCSAGLFITINKIFAYCKGHNGLGQGDIELIACIGAWIGFIGTWCTILISSLSGTIFAVLYMIYTRKKLTILPFGVFLALSATTYIIYQQSILNFILYNIM